MCGSKIALGPRCLSQPRIVEKKGASHGGYLGLLDGLRNPVAFLLSPGNDNDSTHAIELMNKTDITGSNLLGDKAYGTKEILAYINENTERLS